MAKRFTGLEIYLAVTNVHTEPLAFVHNLGRCQVAPQTIPVKT
jgi:hypothetical protein